MAKGPGAAKSVGKVSVRVVPDTSKFREELEAQLKKELAGFSVKVPVKVDTKQLGSLRKQITDTSNDLRGLDFGKAINFDMTPFERSLARVVLAVNRVQEGLKAIGSRAKQLATSFRDSVNVVGRMRSYWQGVRNEVGSTGRSVTRVLSVRAFKGIIGSIQSVGRGFRNIGREANRGLRGLSSLTVATGKGILGMASAAGKATAALIPTSRAGLIFFGVLAGGAPILGLITGLLAGLPSLAFAFLGPIAAIGLGFDGIKEAAGVLSDDVDNLKKSLSKNFAEGLTPVFEQLQSIFPVLDRGLNKVADGTIVWAQAFTDVVTSAKGSAQIENILTNVGQLMKDMAPFITNFTQAFLTMASAGSNQFNLLAQVLNNFAIAFNGMIDRVVGNGVFAKAIEGLSAVTDSLLQLFVRLFEAGLQVMGQIGGPLANLITALGNALIPLIPILGDITNTVASILTPVLNALGTVFQLLAPVVNQFLTLLSTTFQQVFAGILPIIMQVAVVVNQVLTQAFAALQPVVAKLVPIIVQLAQILGDVILKVFQALQPLIGPLVDLFGQLAVIIAETLVSALEALAPVFEILAEFIADLVKELKPLIPSISEVAKILADLLVSALKIAVPLFIQLAKAVLPVVLAAVKALVPFIKQMVAVFKEIVGAIAPIVSAILNALMPAFKAILVVVKPVFDSLVNIIRGAFDIIKGIFDVVIGVLTGDWGRAWDGIKSILSGALEVIWNAIKGAFNLIVDFFANVPGAILDALGNLLGLLWDTGKDIIKGLWDGIVWLWTTVDEWFKGIGKIIGDFFAGCGKWLFNAGRDLVKGLWDGWKRYFKDFEAAVVEDGNTLVDNLKGLFGIHSPSTVFREIGENLGQGLFLGMDSQKNAIFAAGNRMADNVLGGFGTPSLDLDWAKAVEDTTPAALKAVDNFAAKASQHAQTEFSGQLLADGAVQPIADQIAEAMDGVEVKMDSKPVGKLINRNNVLNKRRG